MSNKESARKQLEILKAIGNYPAIIGYREDDQILLYHMNAEAIKEWGIDDRTYDTWRDSSIFAAFDPESYKHFISEEKSKVSLRLNRKGRDKNLEAQIHWYSWGMWIRFEKGLGIDVPSPKKIENVFLGWASLSETTRKLIAAVFGILGVSITSVNLSEITSGKAKATDTEITDILQNQLLQYPDPQPNALIYWEYNQGLTERTLKAQYPESIFEGRQGIVVQDVTESGWYEMVKAHRQGKPYSIRRSKYDKLLDGKHRISRMFDRYQIKQVISAPVRDPSTNRLYAYVSIGLKEEVGDEVEQDIKTRLQITAGVLAQFTHSRD